MGVQQDDYVNRKFLKNIETSFDYITMILKSYKRTNQFLKLHRFQGVSKYTLNLVKLVRVEQVAVNKIINSFRVIISTVR